MLRPTRYRGALIIVLLSGLLAGVAPAEILRVSVEGAIDPITSEYIRDAIALAEEEQVSLLLIKLATPGGLGISMQEIIQEILNSSVPVVCFVGPKGSHAASAGFFILLSADVAAMAPGTNTGAAHPVFPLGMENEVMMEKVRNDALASLRSIVQQRERNYDLAEKAVLESQSFTEKEALEGELIDLIAEDESALLEQLEGLEIRRFSGDVQTLTVTGQTVRDFEMTFRQTVLSVIANPNIALLLGLVGLAGLYLEFSSPGLIVPGVVGAIAFILALVGFSLLPVNYVGVLLIVLALGLFVAEVNVQGFGILGTGGVIALVLGLLLLVDSPYPELRIGLFVALSVALPFAAVTVFVMWVVLKSWGAPVRMGSGGLAGTIGKTKTPVDRTGGKVLIHGEWWDASSIHQIPQGVRVRVVEIQGLRLIVEQHDDSLAS